MSGVAEVIGSAVVPQIVIGSPSPTVEPSVIAPDYRSLPFRPDVVIDGGSNDAMTVRGVSQRGHLHRYNGAPRQDDFVMHHLSDGRVIVVVADGVRGRRNRISARALPPNKPPSGYTPTSVMTSPTRLVGPAQEHRVGTERARADLLGLETPDPVRAEEQLATTLVCAVIEPTGAHTLRAHLISAGDSDAWLLSAGQYVELLTGKTDSPSGVASSAVVGLPRVPTEVVPVVVDIAYGDVLLSAPTGSAIPSEPVKAEWAIYSVTCDQAVTASLIEFAHAVDFSRETFDDDRTSSQCGREEKLSLIRRGRARCLAHAVPWKVCNDTSSDRTQQSRCAGQDRSGRAGRGLWGAERQNQVAASMVYKEYKTQSWPKSITALAAMPALVEDSLSYGEAERLISVAAWPCALVEDTGTPTGFVMPAIPDEFFTPITTTKGTSTTTAEFQHLLNHRQSWPPAASTSMTPDAIRCCAKPPPRWPSCTNTASAWRHLPKEPCFP